VKLVLALLRACEEEGEDLSFSELLEVVEEGLKDTGNLTEGLRGRYGFLPPRVALAAMLRDPEWGWAVRVASRAYPADLLRELDGAC